MYSEIYLIYFVPDGRIYGSPSAVVSVSVVRAYNITSRSISHLSNYTVYTSSKANDSVSTYFKIESNLS